MISDKATFQEQGYLIVPQFFSQDELAPFYDEITRMGKKLVDDDFDFFKGSANFTPQNQSLFYDALRYLPALYRMSSSPRLLEFCRELGLDFPCVMGSCNMRLDRPNDSRHLFQWHQDTLYLLGSSNAVTIWVPFGQVNPKNGTISVIPGSHKQGIYPYKRISDKPVLEHIPLLQRDLALDCEIDETKEVVVNAGPGDLIIFYQMLLHRSLPNLSNNIRWTCQVRVADLFEEEFIKNRYPMGERTNIYFVNYEKPKTSVY
jgi:ectoine hydroxylase-related dioxygenase (phytanoyl-CoA dioxygenase family)